MFILSCMLYCIYNYLYLSHSPFYNKNKIKVQVYNKYRYESNFELIYIDSSTSHEMRVFTFDVSTCYNMHYIFTRNN